jgi:YHS domain-containing protein
MVTMQRLFALMSVVCLASVLAAAKDKQLVNTDTNGVALHGYDPVAYFTEHAAVKGEDRHRASYNGATYYFASDANKKLFQRDPAKFAPQYGGYCAMAVSMGQLEDADPTMFVVHQDKLLVQRNEKAHQMFMSNVDANHRRADQQWPALVEKNGK